MADNDQRTDNLFTGDGSDALSDSLRVSDTTAGDAGDSRGSSRRINLSGFRGTGNRTRNTGGTGERKSGGLRGLSGKFAYPGKKPQVLVSSQANTVNKPAPKPRAKKRKLGATIAGEAIAPLLTRGSRIFGQWRRVPTPDGRREPLYFTEPKPDGTRQLLWELDDTEAVALGNAVGAFAKYLPLSEEQTALSMDISNLALVMTEIVQGRLMIERMHLINQRMAMQRHVTQEHNGSQPTTVADLVPNGSPAPVPPGTAVPVDENGRPVDRRRFL